MTRQCLIGQLLTGNKYKKKIISLLYPPNYTILISFILFLYICRQDSTIVTPYESWQYYDENIVSLPQDINFAANKTKKVAWFVSNCGARNGRLQYAQELSQYIRNQ